MVKKYTKIVQFKVLQNKQLKKLMIIYRPATTLHIGWVQDKNFFFKMLV
jgi:hypothetical protein